MTEYNGHKSWNFWNVSLWFSNDEGLYRCAVNTIKRTKSLDRAAQELYDALKGTKTPDGAPYTKGAIREAIRGME